MIFSARKVGSVVDHDERKEASLEGLEQRLRPTGGHIALRWPLVALVLVLALFLQVITGKKPDSEAESRPSEDLATPLQPGLSGVTFTTTLANGGGCVLETERIGVRSRTLGRIVFQSFKEITVSRARVTLHGASTAEWMDWMTPSRIATLSAPIVADRTFEDRTRLLGLRLVVSPLEVVLVSPDGALSPVIQAESAACDPFSDRVSFTGCLRVSLGDGHFLFGCDGATWDISARTLRFEGDSFHDDVHAENRAVSLTSLTPTPAPARDAPGRGVTSRAPGTVGADQIQALLKGKDSREANRTMLELLALNPDLLNRANISPFSFFGSGFKLGAFKPPPLLGRISIR